VLACRRKQKAENFLMFAFAFHEKENRVKKWFLSASLLDFVQKKMHFGRFLDEIHVKNVFEKRLREKSFCSEPRERRSCSKPPAAGSSLWFRCAKSNPRSPGPDPSLQA
jgi:hypothetical protein